MDDETREPNQCETIIVESVPVETGDTNIVVFDPDRAHKQQFQFISARREQLDKLEGGKG